MVQNDTLESRETTLSPEVRRIRNSIIKKFAHEPLDIMAKFVKDVVENEQDTVKRLGAMAARVEILRMRILQISKNDSEFLCLNKCNIFLLTIYNVLYSYSFLYVIFIKVFYTDSLPKLSFQKVFHKYSLQKTRFQKVINRD